MKQNRLVLIILFSLSFLLYANTLKHGYVLDDFSVIKENFVVKKGLDGISEIWKTHYRYGYGYQDGKLYRPLSLTLFAVQWQLAPDAPIFAHFMNVFLYAVLSCLLFIFLVQLLGEDYRLLAFIAVLLFAAHPIHTEVVANIKSVDDILVFILSILAYLLLFRYLKTNKTSSLIGSLTLIGFAFFAKESTITLVGMIPFMLVLFKNIPWKQAITISSLYAIPTAIFLFVRHQVLGQITNSSNTVALDNVLVSAPNEAIRIATALKVMGLYLWKLILPHPLMNDYSVDEITLTGFKSIYPWLSLAVVVIMIWTIVKFWKEQKVLSFSLLFFLITLSLYTNLFITIGTIFGERLLFIPSLGFSILVAYLILLPFQKKAWIRQLDLKKASSPLLITFLLVAAYGFKTVDRNKAWKDNFTLYSTDVKNCDNSARCHYYYGISLMKDKALNTKIETEKRKLITSAIQSLQKAVQIYPNYSEAYGEIGLGYYRLKDFKNAEQAYLKAIKLNQGNASAHSNLGSLYFDTQNYQAAKAAYQKALKANPNHIDALANYASTLGTLGEFQSAITYFKKAIALKPNEPNYYQMVGMTYQNLGNQQQAQVYFQKAKKLQ